MKACRIDKMPSFAETMIEKDFKIAKHDQESAFTDSFKDTVDLRPLLVLFSSGENVSSFIEHISLNFNSDLISVALGSIESIKAADRVLTNLTKDNTWILLENIHLSGAWVQTLEKRLHHIQFGSNSHLILTSKREYPLPTTILRSCRLAMLEDSEGVKINMESNLSLCRSGKKGPKELPRILFLICWLHTIILERTKYCPIGWASNYAFCDTDLVLSLQIVEDWITAYASGKSNISPDLLPWKAVRALIGGIYGDKMDKITDLRILDSMIKYFLKPEMFDDKCKINFPTGEGSETFVPQGTTFIEFKNWLEQLPQDSLNWIGFAQDMDMVVNVKKGS